MSKPKLQKFLALGPFGSMVSEAGGFNAPPGKGVDCLNLRTDKSVGYFVAGLGRTTYYAGFAANTYIWFAVGKIVTRTVNTSTTPYTYTTATYYVALAANFIRQKMVLVYFNGSGYTEIDIGSGIPTTGAAPNPRYTPQPQDEAVAVSMGGETYFCYGKIYGPYWDVNGSFDLDFALQCVKINELLNGLIAHLPPPNALGNGSPQGASGTTTATVGGAGNLSGNYSYYFTAQRNIDGNIQESSPTPLTVGLPSTLPSGQVLPASRIVIITASSQVINIAFSTGYYAALTGDPYDYSTSTGTDFVQINVYRNSSASQSGQPQLVGSFPLSNLNSGGTYTFQDDLADNQVTGQALIVHQDPPPNFFTMCTHKSRMWGFGYGLLGRPADVSNPTNTTFHTNFPHGSELWYSAVNQPWAWDNTNQVIDCGRNDQGDNGVALAEVGSVLLALKTKSTWIVYGSTPADFIQEPIFAIGAISQRLTISAYGAVYWVSPNGQIWMYNGQLQCISGDIQEELYTLLASSSANFYGGYGWVQNRSIFFCFNSIVYEYQIDRNEWWKNGLVCGIGYYNTETQECLGFLNNASTTFAKYAVTFGDFGNVMGSSWTSQVLDCDAPETTKEFTHILLESQNFPASATITITVDPGALQIQQSIAVALNSTQTRQMISLPKGLIGFEVQVQVAVVTAQYFEIQRVTLYGIPRRTGIVAG